MSETTLSRLGWTLSALFALFMLGASVAPKLMGMPIAQETMAALGWPEAPVVLIGVLELVCTLLFLFPPTGLLGAVLMMAILGGAIVTQLRGKGERPAVDGFEVDDSGVPAEVESVFRIPR